MRKTRVAINGFGRIGRVLYRVVHNDPTIEVVAINDLTDSHTLAHLLKYDSVHRQFQEDISSDKDHIIAGKNKIKVISYKDPSLLPWKELGIDIVVECTGHFLDKVSAEKHLIAGAKKVILSAPPTDNEIKT
ncbi:MAG TPA: glyceraldehyde 3-phosphate dehydrogenase NAD-binding domain-containing protein, partial [Nitrosopumilaceae archaeon]|nr:glyceraldehyde 3-phosphate dehydrogenase NAD-binding domain-containing protein [Nitrosopumilaceae archaeon]